MTTYPDPLPFKLNVLRALTDAFKEITPANGYINDLSDFDPGDSVPTERVYRGRAWFGDSDPDTMVSVLEAPSAADLVADPPIATTSAEVDWELVVQGFVTDDPVHPTDPAYLLLADMRKRLSVERNRKVAGSRSQLDPLGLGTGRNRITEIRYGSGVVRPPDEVSSKAWLWLPVTLRIVEDAADPYA